MDHSLMYQNINAFRLIDVILPKNNNNNQLMKFQSSVVIVLLLLSFFFPIFPPFFYGLCCCVSIPIRISQLKRFQILSSRDRPQSLIKLILIIFFINRHLTRIPIKYSKTWANFQKNHNTERNKKRGEKINCRTYALVEERKFQKNKGGGGD